MELPKGYANVSIRKYQIEAFKDVANFSALTVIPEPVQCTI